MCRLTIVFFVRRLDAQKDYGKTIYGGGYLLSDAAADYIDSKRIEAERKRIEAEEEKSIVWPLSERERKIIYDLGK